MADTAQKRARLLAAENFLRQRLAARRHTVPLILRTLEDKVRCWGCKKDWTGNDAKVPIKEARHWHGHVIYFVICHECVANGIDPQHARRDFVRRFP